MVRIVVVAAFAVAACGGAAGANRSAKSNHPVCPSQPPSTTLDAKAIERLDATPIARTCVYGVDENDRDAIEQAIRSRTGQGLHAKAVADDLRVLMKTGRFDDVKASAIPIGNDVLVFFVLRPRPRIADVTFEGASELEKEGLPKHPELMKLRYLSQGKLYEAKGLIRDEYHRRGYRQVSVDVSTSLEGPRLARVKFVVVEGPRSKIGPMTFVGVSKVSTADLRSASRLAVGTPFEDEMLDRAVVSIQEVYLDRGMIQVKVEPSVGEPATDGSTPITWNIVEGDVFHVGALTIGNVEGSADKPPSPKLKTKKGAPLSRSDIYSDVSTLVDAFAARQQKVTVVPRREIDVTTRTVHVIFEASLAP